MKLYGNLRNKTNEQRKKERGKTRNGVVTIENELTVTSGEVGRGVGKIGGGD